MTTLETFSLPFDFSKMKKAADLIYENGTLLALYLSENDYYLFLWADCNETFNRWMIFRTTLKDLSSYIYGKMPLYDLVVNNPDGFVRFADYSGHGKFPSETLSLPVNKIPGDYLPDEDSYFEFEITDEIKNVISPKNYKISVPEKEQSLFFTLMDKLGWKSTAAVW